MEDADCVWVMGRGPFLIGRIDALDGGWSLGLGTVRRFGVANLTLIKNSTIGVGLILGKQMYCLFVRWRW
jgi:hypothetical protein